MLICRHSKASTTPLHSDWKQRPARDNSSPTQILNGHFEKAQGAGVVIFDTKCPEVAERKACRQKRHLYPTVKWASGFTDVITTFVPTLFLPDLEVRQLLETFNDDQCSPHIGEVHPGKLRTLQAPREKTLILDCACVQHSDLP
jgi:hypothetical protein